MGSHPIVHPNFCLLDAGTARRELAQSKADLERVIGRPVSTFSFPYGAWDERSVELARQVGYSGVFTIEPSTGRAGQQMFRTGRTRIDLDDWPLEFRLKALGAYSWLATASALKRRIRAIVDRRHDDALQRT
jgi:peptidoglycan/xylan/chitin deacetylase (PgdA/CDA1 family)